MALPDNISAYDDCFDLFDRACADPKGARALIGSFEQAKRYQMRMNTARALQRKESKRIYKPDELAYGKSEYDYLKVTTRFDNEEQWWVYVEPHREDVLLVQGLSELDGYVEYEEVLQIEDATISEPD